MSQVDSRVWRRILIVFVGVALVAPLAAFVGRPANGVLLVVETRGLDTAALEATGARVVVDYGNGLALLRTSPVGGDLPAGVRLYEHPFGSRTYLDVDISGTVFNSATGEPSVPAGLQGSGGEYLLQFIGPVKSEWVRDIEALGVEFGQGFYNYAFAVRAPAGLVETLRGLPTVEWVGLYHPAYKISSYLRDDVGQVQATASGWPSVTLEALEDVVRNAGGTVLQSWTMPSTVQFVAARAQVDEVARSSLVLRVDKSWPIEVYDSRAGQIHKFHLAWSTAKSSLPYSITGRSPGPDGNMYNGDDQFEGFGVMDTGFDEGNANDGALDFFDSPNGDRVIRFQDRTFCSTPDGSIGGTQASAHGTHVIGIIASDGYSWETHNGLTTIDKQWDQSEAGVAPEAKLSIDGVKACSGTGLIANIVYWDTQYSDGYTTGNPNPASRAWVVTHSNSWGGGAGYGTTAGGVDSRMDTAPYDRMIVFAAGNGGPGVDTLQGEALGKNGLAAGASDNYRPDQFEADNPNLIADFSSRGGPGLNGRIKPDLVAVGTAVVSNFASGEWVSKGSVPQPDYIMSVDEYDSASQGPGSDGIPDYRYLQGTSMATPHLAAMHGLTREYLREVVGLNNALSPWFDPPSYAAKALLINGAVRMDENLYAYPGYDQGWGRADLEMSLFPPVPRTNQITIGQITTTGTCSIGTVGCPAGTLTTGVLNTNVVGSSVPLKVTLVWLDPTGNSLQRNLELQVIAPGGTEYRGDRYTNGWSTPNPPTYDAVNTVEQVEVQTPEIGVWTVNVIGTTVPSTARFAVVIAADVGPQEQYKVDLTPQAPTAFSVAPGGSAVFPFSILNYGTDQDTVDLTTTAPASLTVNFLPSNSYFLDSGESVNAFAIVSANPAATPGVYAFDIKGTSFNDPSVSDFIPLTVEVLNAPLPNPLLVTNLTVDELDPSVVAFRDGTVGGHIFIVYRRSTAVQSPPNDYLGGVNVWVAHALLDANGLPILPFDYRAISGMNDQPNDLRVIRIPSGTYANRIIVTWTGIDPNGTTDQAAWGRVAYLDAGAGPSYYTGSWQVRTIEINYGSQFSNAARVSFPLFRQASPDPEGELYWVWEHLDSDSGGTLQSVRTNMIRSQDGGDTWPACGLWSPTNINCILISPDNTNYYFFPNGVVDQNDVAWIFFYWRTSGGNDRDLNVRLYNGLAGTATPYAAASMSGAINIYDTTDNVQWPAAVSIDPDGGATNRVYFVVTRDECGVDLNMYVAYAEGLYSSTSPPTAILNPGGSCPTLNANLSPSFTLVSPAGGLGTSISNANYNRRPILNIVGTVDAGPSTTVWLPVMENSNPYNQPNLWSWYTNPGFAQGTMSKITADAFAKGHQMSSTLTSGTVGRVYEVWHANKGGVTGVNYNVYLAIYSKNWEGAADTEGPVVPWQGTVPPIVNLTQGSSFEVLANINDISTGNSDIQSAEYQIDGGAWTPLNPVDAFDSPAEGARATADASSLLVGMHTLCVRGTDVVPNLGTAVCTFFEVAGASPGDIIPPDPPTVTGAVLSGGSNADVDVRWDASPDEGIPGGTVEYRILRATAIAGPYNQIGLVLAAMLPSYTYTCVACGHGDVTNYFFKIRAADNVSNVADATAIAAKYTVAVRQGTNLLSVPLQQADWSVAEVLQTLTFDRVRAYRAAQADPWKAWYAGRPGDLTAFQFNDAFWVTTTAAGRYTIAGLVQNTPSVALVSGWNLVGYADWVGETASASLTLLSWTRVETFDAAAPAAPYNLRRVLGSETLVGGQAYWVFLTAAGNWVQG